MSISFSSVGHVFASIAHSVVKAEKAVVNALPKLIEAAKKVASKEQTVEQITGAIVTAATGQPALGIAAEEIERQAFAVFGVITHAAVTADAALEQKLKDVGLDSALLAELRTVGANILAAAKAKGLSV